MMKAIEAAIERLRRLYAGVESYHEVYGCPPTGLGHQQRDERLVLDYVLAEHPSDGPSAAEELREARRLLERARTWMSVGGRPAAVETDRDINSFLARTSRFEK